MATVRAGERVRTPEGFAGLVVAVHTPFAGLVWCLVAFTSFTEWVEAGELVAAG